jgi:hypothetical protein
MRQDKASGCVVSMECCVTSPDATQRPLDQTNLGSRNKNGMAFLGNPILARMDIRFLEQIVFNLCPFVIHLIAFFTLFPFWKQAASPVAWVSVSVCKQVY